MDLHHLVIDDFFPDPEAVRKHALSLNYPPRPERASYPGRNAAEAIPLPGIARVMSQVVQEPLTVAPHSSHAHPRIALAGEGGKVAVHADFCHWSAIAFLSRPEDCRGGTHFYRHKPTGWERAPVWPGEAEAKGYASADAAMRQITGTDTSDESLWEETMMLPMRFNRLVIFRGYLWHDAGESFGDTPESGRLIVPFFFENTQAG